MTKTTLTLGQHSTIDDWADAFWEVYGTQDRRRGISETWLHTVGDATRVGEAVRLANFGFALRYVGHTFCWILSFINKLNYDRKVPDRFVLPGRPSISEILWNAYPGICSTCLNRSCVCVLMAGKPSSSVVEAQLLRARQREARPKTVDEWQAMFESIYDAAHFVMPVTDMTFHFLEEVGEVSEAIMEIAIWRRRDGMPVLLHRQRNLMRELADAVSWCYSLVSKFSGMVNQWDTLPTSGGATRPRKTHSIKLSTVLMSEYLSAAHKPLCPVCRNAPCNCEAAAREWVLGV